MDHGMIKNLRMSKEEYYCFRKKKVMVTSSSEVTTDLSQLEGWVMAKSKHWHSPTYTNITHILVLKAAATNSYRSLSRQKGIQTHEQSADENIPKGQKLQVPAATHVGFLLRSVSPPLLTLYYWVVVSEITILIKKWTTSRTLKERETKYHLPKVE